MTIKLTNDKDVTKLKATFDLLKYINNKVSDEGLCRYYNDKYKLVASDSTHDIAYKELIKYIKEDPDKRVGKK